MNITKLQKDLLKFFEGKGCNSSNAISKLTGIPQPTVFRSLYRVRTKMTKGLEKLCEYSKIDAEKYNVVDPSMNPKLMKTLSIVWNGTEAHANRLSKLLLASHSANINYRN